MLLEGTPTAAHATLYDRLADKWQAAVEDASLEERQAALPHFIDMAKTAGAYVVEGEDTQAVLNAVNDMGNTLVKIRQDAMHGEVSQELSQRVTHRLMYGAYTGAHTPESAQNIARAYDVLKLAANYTHLAPAGMEALSQAVEEFANGELTDAQAQGAIRLAADVIREAPQVAAFVAEHIEDMGSQLVGRFTLDTYTKQPDPETFSKLMLTRKCITTTDAHALCQQLP